MYTTTYKQQCCSSCELDSSTPVPCKPVVNMEVRSYGDGRKETICPVCGNVNTHESMTQSGEYILQGA